MLLDIENKNKDFKIIYFLINVINKIVTFKGKCYLNCLEEFKDFFDKYPINKFDEQTNIEHFKQIHELLIRKIEEQENYPGNLFRIVSLMAEYFQYAFLNGKRASIVNGTFLQSNI